MWFNLLFISYDSHKLSARTINPLNKLNQLFFLVDSQYVSCEVGTIFGMFFIWISEVKTLPVIQILHVGLSPRNSILAYT